METPNGLMSVCAITINYNRPETTVRCIESLRNQGLAALVIVENSDSEQSICMFKRMITCLDRTGLPEDTVVLQSGSNLGYAKGMNSAIAWSSENRNHSYFLLLNNDALMPPEGLNLLLETCLKSPSACVVVPAFLDAGTPGHFWYQKVFGIMTRNRIPGSFRFLSGCCLLVPKTVIDGKLFDEDFFMYGEDVFLSWKLSQSRIALLTSDFRISHEGRASSSGNSAFYEYQVLRGHFLLAGKLSASSRMRALFLLGRIAFFSTRALYRSLRFRSITPIAVFCRCVRELPSLIKPAS